MNRILIILVIFCVTLQDSSQAFAQSRRSIFGTRSITRSRNIFGVRQRTNFFAISSAGRIPHKLTTQAYRVRRTNSSRLYGPQGIRRNYFGKQTLPSSGSKFIPESLEDYAAPTLEAIDDYIQDGYNLVDSGPGFSRF